MNIKWHTDVHNSARHIAIVGTENIGYAYFDLDGDYHWRITKINVTDAEGRACSLEKAKKALSKEWHSFLERCGYRAPRPKQRRSKYDYLLKD